MVSKIKQLNELVGPGHASRSALESRFSSFKQSENNKSHHLV